MDQPSTSLQFQIQENLPQFGVKNMMGVQGDSQGQSESVEFKKPNHDSDSGEDGGVGVGVGPVGPDGHVPTHSQYYTLPIEKEQQLRTIYKRLDVNKDGRVDIRDLKEAFSQHGTHAKHSTSYAEAMMRKADTSGNSDIDFKEFVHYVLEHEKRLAVAFKSLDRNQDGIVDRQELKVYFQDLGVVLDDAQAEKIVDRVSLDDSGTIDMAEFQKYFLFVPIENISDFFVDYWRHNLKIDIGEDGPIPEDFTEKELKTGLWWRHLLAGGAAGTVSRTCTAPLDRLKVLLQVHSTKENGLKLFSGMDMLLKEGGIKGLWRGNGVNVMKIAPESALKFMAYEKAKTLIKGGNTKDLAVLERFLAGSMAGSFSQTVIYPMEVLKTRLALRKSGELNRGLIHAAITIYKTDGLRAFYRGYIPNLIGIIPYAGIDLAIYETLKRWYVRRRGGDHEPGVLAVLACGTVSSSCGQLASYPLALVRTRLQANSSSTPQPGTMLGQFQSIWVNEGFPGLYRGITPTS